MNQPLQSHWDRYSDGDGENIKYPHSHEWNPHFCHTNWGITMSITALSARSFLMLPAHLPKAVGSWSIAIIENSPTSHGVESRGMPTHANKTPGFPIILLCQDCLSAFSMEKSCFIKASHGQAYLRSRGGSRHLGHPSSVRDRDKKDTYTQE